MAEHKAMSYGPSALFLLFLGLKLAEVGAVATWPWLWVAAPLWVPTLVWLVVIVAVAAIAATVKLANAMPGRRLK